MKKKIALLIIAALMISSVFSACGSNGDNAAVSEQGEKQSESDTKSNEENQNAENQNADAAAVQGEPEHIVVTYMYYPYEVADLKNVQDKVNEITIPEINVEVEFIPISAVEAQTSYSLLISSGEVIDLMIIMQDIKNYTDSGQLEPLNDYITPETTPAIYARSQEFPLLVNVQDEIYGIRPIQRYYGSQPGLTLRRDYFDEISYEEKDIYSFEDLTNIFAEIKEIHPDMYPLGITGANAVGKGRTSFTFFHSIALVGSYGALMDKNSTQAVNLFTTEEYKNYLKQMAEWYDAGYILPDAATSELSLDELFSSLKSASYPMTLNPDIKDEHIGLQLDEVYIATAGITYWTMPITTKNPEAAVRFLDYVYGNAELANLIGFGIEGEHYNLINAGEKKIEFTNGDDYTTSPFYNGLNYWGDARESLTYEEVRMKEEYDSYTEAALQNQFQSYGFDFDNTNVFNKMIACQSVLDQYQVALETGSLGSKWEATYDQMVSQLETAGVQDVIDEWNIQFKAYLDAQ